MGPWWPAPSAALRAAAQHWATWAMQKQELARNLISQHDLLLRNQGRTAEDLIGRYLRGAKSEVTKAEKYEIKKGAFNTAADAIDYLRSRLTGIAGEGNKEIDDVLASKKPLPEQLKEFHMSDQITYNPGAVSDFASDVGSRAGQLHMIYEDTASKTNALQEFFAGHGAQGFFDAQAQMLSGLQGLIETVGQHGTTTGHVLDNAIGTDQAIAGLF